MITKKYFFVVLILFITSFFGSGCNYRSFQVRDTSHISLVKVEQKKEYSFLSDSSYSNVFIEGVPDKYKVYFDIVCRSFSELKYENIVFKLKKIKTTMQTRPVRIFGKRKYKIWVNNNKDFEGIKFDDIPFNAKIGIIAHEMAHILDYKNKKSNEIVMTGMKFLNKKEQRAYERTIDSLTVIKGFGYQLRDWAQFAMYESDATDEYKSFKKEIYMNPSEIDSLIYEIKKHDLEVIKNHD